MRNYLIQFIKLGLCFTIAYFVSLFSMEYIVTNPDENTMLIVFMVQCVVLFWASFCIQMIGRNDIIGNIITEIDNEKHYTKI